MRTTMERQTSTSVNPRFACTFLPLILPTDRPIPRATPGPPARIFARVSMNRPASASLFSDSGESKQGGAPLALRGLS